MARIEVFDFGMIVKDRCVWSIRNKALNTSKQKYLVIEANAIMGALFNFHLTDQKLVIFMFDSK